MVVNAFSVSLKLKIDISPIKNAEDLAVLQWAC
jgi:hypothetical protein